MPSCQTNEGGARNMLNLLRTERPNRHLPKERQINFSERKM